MLARVVTKGAATRRPILVTGSHRSGTTWIGQVLAADSSVAYIHEPFALSCRPGVFPYHIPFWFFSVPEPPPPELVSAYRDLLRFHYAFGAEMRAIESPSDVARMIRDAARFALFRVQKRRPLIKDPLALLSADWIARSFDCSVIVSTRHPVAFVSSLLRLGWRIDFANLRNQQQLMQGLLKDSEEDVIEGGRVGADDPLLEAAYLWKILHRVIARYREERPEWIFLRYEDLARGPLKGFESIFAKFGLQYDGKVQKMIEFLSGGDNPPDRATDARVTRVASSAYSEQSLRRLSAEDCARVRSVVAPVSHLFYSDEEW